MKPPVATSDSLRYASSLLVSQSHNMDESRQIYLSSYKELRMNEESASPSDQLIKFFILRSSFIVYMKVWRQRTS